MAGDKPLAPEDTGTESLRSRSDQRRETQKLETQLMDLAMWLVKQNARVLDKLGLGEETRASVQDARHIDAPAARKRAYRLVRTALRDTDLVALQRRIEAVKYGEARTGAETEAETWTVRLLAGGEGDVSVFVAAHPSADRQRVRQLVRNAKKAPEGKATEARKALAKGLLEAVRAAPPAQDTQDTQDTQDMQDV